MVPKIVLFLVTFLTNFGAILGPEIGPKSDPKLDQFLEGHDSGSGGRGGVQVTILRFMQEWCLGLQFRGYVQQKKGEDIAI